MLAITYIFRSDITYQIAIYIRDDHSAMQISPLVKIQKHQQTPIVVIPISCTGIKFDCHSNHVYANHVMSMLYLNLIYNNTLLKLLWKN